MARSSEKPWTAQCSAVEFWEIQDAQGKLIATVWGDGANEEDARLMAASPRMLSVLKKIMECDSLSALEALKKQVKQAIESAEPEKTPKQ